MPLTLSMGGGRRVRSCKWIGKASKPSGQSGHEKDNSMWPAASETRSQPGVTVS